jgi:hypothetical protein
MTYDSAPDVITVKVYRARGVIDQEFQLCKIRNLSKRVKRLLNFYDWGPLERYCHQLRVAHYVYELGFNQLNPTFSIFMKAPLRRRLRMKALMVSLRLGNVLTSF